jgi:hypothetical protein
MKLTKLIPLLLLFSCSTSGPVDTKLDDSVDIKIVEPPKSFHSNLDELNQIKYNLDKVGDWSTFRYQALLQREDEIISEIENTQSELSINGGIDLIPGQSYSFKVQSFCVHPGAYRPITGDGFRVGEMRGKASKWLPEILEKLPNVKVSQNRVQSLIWNLLTGAHYDELNEEDKRNLKLFFDDGMRRFGSSTLNDIGSAVFKSVVPREIEDTIEEFSSLKEQFSRYQGDFKKLESILAPKSNRLNPIPVGWMQMKDGYLLKVTSHGYSETRIDIYVPEEGNNRKPQSKFLFKLSNLVALPSISQRLALSHKLNIPQRTNNDKNCRKYQNFRPKNCSEMSESIRDKILSIASPSHFIRSRYKSPPDNSKQIEIETDCSRFTQQIFERAGLYYPYSGTATFQCLSVFKEIPREQGKAGDLVLYRGHIGILSKNASVISATVGGVKNRSKLYPDDPAFLPTITELPMEKAGFGKPKIMQWSCP